MVRVFDIITVDGAFRPLNVFHRCGQVRSMSIISVALRRFFLIEKVLSGCLALHLAFLKDFTKRRLFLLEEMQVISEYLIGFVRFACLRFNIRKEVLLDGVASRWPLQLLENRIVHI